MEWKMPLKKCIANIFSSFRHFKGPRQGLRILMYHSVSNGVKDDPSGFFTVDPLLFASQIKILAESSSIKLVNFSDGINIDSNKSLKIAVTFDDGYKDTLHVVAPIMHKYRIPFTVFVISDFVKHKVKDYLNEKELFELSQLPNVTIGSHGSTHTPLTELSEPNLIEELVSSKKYLEDVTSRNINTISYPHGSINKKVRSEAINAGYKIGGTSHFNINNYSIDPMLLSRTLINVGDYERIFKQKLNGSWDWNRFRNIGSLVK